MISFELLVERLEVGLLELLPLVEKAVERLRAEVPRFDLCCGGSLVGVFDLLFDAGESEAYGAEIWRAGWASASATAASAAFGAGDCVEFGLECVVACGYGRLRRARFELVAEDGDLVDGCGGAHEVVVDGFCCVELRLQISG